MSEIKKYYEAKVYCKHSHPFAYMTLTDFGYGKGLLQIHSDWGTYSYYWGSMGCNIKDFLLETSPSYIHQKLQSCLIYQDTKKDSQRKLDRFMIHCWPELIEILKESV